MMLDRLTPRLRSEIEAARARVRVGFPFWMRPFVARGVIGVTLGRTIYLAPELIDGADVALAQILRHELAHVRQVARDGITRFIVRYLVEYATQRRKGLPHVAAYEAISYEREAMAAEETDEGRVAGIDEHSSVG
jgi:hypothetical protein